MLDGILPRFPHRKDRHEAGWPLASTLAGFGLAILAGALAWHDPSRNGWAAAALAGALTLEQVGLRAELRAGREHGREARLGDVPSIIRGFEHGAGRTLATGVFAGTALAWPVCFAVLASTLAGLVALRAIARLALVRIVRQTAIVDDRET